MKRLNDRLDKLLNILKFNIYKKLIFFEGKLKKNKINKLCFKTIKIE